MLVQPEHKGLTDCYVPYRTMQLFGSEVVRSLQKEKGNMSHHPTSEASGSSHASTWHTDDICSVLGVGSFYFVVDVFFSNILKGQNVK